MSPIADHRAVYFALQCWVRMRASPDSTHAIDAVLRGGGEMGALMRSIDWARTAVGEVEGWPQSLRTALSILLETGFPMYIAWGPEFTQFYNDGYRPILGSTKHPAAMGISTRETFAEIWHIIGPMFSGVMEGRPTTVVDFLLPLDRHGFVEECYFIFSYSPIRQEDGSVGGVLVTVTETTKRVIGERRLETSRALATRTREARTALDACAIGASVLAENDADVPLALVYLVEKDGRTATLAGTAGAAPDAPATIDLRSGGSPWPLAEAVDAGRPLRLDGSAGARIVLPIVAQGVVLGVLVAGTSPRLVLDDDYEGFLALVASQLGAAITSARSLEEAQARADALAQLDRAKTAFFSNVSHEFRTPLTLMLGPTEDALASQDAALRGEDLATVHRNQVRLLRLVNTLLDFSRIEAGRATATFEPVDLVLATTDLASAFRSAIERAGLKLEVRCAPIDAPVWVDRSMWEKIVLNLLSNALKFTFEGRIEVALEPRGDRVVLEVRDTGIGIPEDQLAHVFERFHRIESARSRTHEGSGIGLALVRELVTMHGGKIEVASTLGAGTTFTVSIPTGRAHLPERHVLEAPASTTAPSCAPSFVEEAMRWIPGAGREPASRPAHPVALEARILVADDNADMREYLARLLGDRWTVETASDGAAALESIRRAPPDLLLTDVMMPRLDGFDLLQRLRADERTRAVPVIVLSAQAGEEARIEGLDAGADDYLVKPFSARELLARVEAQLVRAKVRSVEEEHGRRLARIFEQAPVAVAILRGPEHVFELANPRYVELVGDRPLVGHTIRDALPELRGQGIFELLDGVYASGEPHVGHAVRLQLERGGRQVEAFFDFVYQPLREVSGSVSGIAVVAFEVTELARARRDAESASRAKDEFLAMLGHELRNPLAPILTALELMRLGAASPEKIHAIIERQVGHVVALVDDLLDVSRIARGVVELRRERVALADVVARAIEMTRPAIDRGRHELAVDVPRDLVVDGDARRLAQVIANLLTNAAKYTEPGGHVRVVARRDGEMLELSVQDDGVGITPETLPFVFDLFVQERQASDRSQGGLGLGLAIVRSFVEAHGGRVEARSDGPGQGTTMLVHLPLADAPAASAGAAHAKGDEPASGVPVLVVDDNEDAAHLLADALRTLGHQVRVAHDGPSALRLLDEFQPRAALLDLGLPVMDGFELAQHLRGDPRFGSIELIAITGYGTVGDRERARAAGFDAHLVKPVTLEEVDGLLRRRALAAHG